MASTRPRLDSATIIAHALQLLNEEGYDALTLRRLATRLGVQAPALYWYFADRSALLGAMVEALMEQVPGSPAPTDRADLYGWITHRGAALREILLSVRDSARLMGDAALSPRMVAQFKQVIEETAGLDKGEATMITGVLHSYVLGWVSYQQQPEMRRFLDEVLDVDEAFTTGLRALGAGMAEQLRPPA